MAKNIQTNIFNILWGDKASALHKGMCFEAKAKLIVARGDDPNRIMLISDARTFVAYE